MGKKEELRIEELTRVVAEMHIQAQLTQRHMLALYDVLGRHVDPQSVEFARMVAYNATSDSAEEVVTNTIDALRLDPAQYTYLLARAHLAIRRFEEQVMPPGFDLSDRWPKD